MDDYADSISSSRIVSFRLAHDEYRKLSRWKRETGMTMSSMLRELVIQIDENPLPAGSAVSSD